MRVRRVELPHGLRDTVAALRTAGERPALLESDDRGWSYITGPAVATLYTDAGGTWLRRAGHPCRRWDDPFEALADVLPARPPQQAGAAPDFVGGWIGVLGYDTARYLHALPATAADDLGLPRMWWLAVDQVLAYEHSTGAWWACTCTGPDDAWPWTRPGRQAAWDRTLVAAGTTPIRTRWAAGALARGMDRPAFEDGVRTIRRAIAAGDYMQVNLTRREEAPFLGDPWALYEDLAAVHPAPYRAFIEGPGVALASCSPERFLKLKDGQVQARPIKGTAARGTDEAEDAARRDWLRDSAKDRAENLMIVDLMRNDLGRVAAVGSVRVPSLFALEPHASVWQMVSTVEATLRADCGPVDLLRACWPPGSMTGAPKLAAMRAIEALEPTRRGWYAGSAGYLDCRGNLDLSVIIRSAVISADRVSVQVGGGIVADSEPRSEWFETVAKAERLVEILTSRGR